MEELSVISRQTQGVISIDNFEQLKQALSLQLETYRNAIYTEDTLKAAKKDKATLNKLKKAIDERRKEIKKQYMQPYEAVEQQFKELIALIDEPLALIGGFITQEEAIAQQVRRDDILCFYAKESIPLGEFAEALFNSPAFYEAKWDKPSTSVKAYQDAIRKKIATASTDISSICVAGGTHTAALLERYFSTLSMAGLTEYKTSLEAAEEAAHRDVPSTMQSQDKVIGYKILRLSGTEQQIAQIIDQMELLGIEVEEIEDGMPQPMEELSAPTFDSFVAFDIETTGTYGAANGDAAPQITEIGAVKVVNGQIVARFSELANPGRPIVPRIARLTGITNEMVANKPPISEVMQQFLDFVGDSVLVGHNIKNCDIPYISRAAKEAGLVLETPYFDTYRFAKTLRKAYGWENVKLEYLSQQFGISQPDAHRAWCDAEANVGVYFKLKELGVNSDGI